MDELLPYRNDSFSATQTNAVMALLSIISNHFLVGSFSIISDARQEYLVDIQKKASKINVAVGFNEEKLGIDDKRGFLILEEPSFDFSEVFKTKPRIVVTVLFTNETEPNLPMFLSKLTIPYMISFFVVLLSENPEGFLSDNVFVKGRTYKIYKPEDNLQSKAYPIMSYEEDRRGIWTWRWETSAIDWGFSKMGLNMSDVTLTIALVSHLDTALKVFLKGKNSFFWKEMARYLKFKPNYHLEKISVTAGKSITMIYIKLLMTMADGLAILPVITPERTKHLEFVLTGLDSKNHLMVRTPRFVHSWQSILKPFSLESWLCLGVAVLLIAVALNVVTQAQNSELNFSSCLLTIVGFVCCQGSDHIPKNLSGRLVCYTGLIFSIIMYQFYTSNFYSLLSTKDVSLPFNSLEQFLAKKTHSLHVHPDTGIYSFITKAENGTLKRLWNEVLRKDPLHKLTAINRVKAFEKVCRGSGALFGLPFQITHVPDLKCKVVCVNSGYFPANVVTIVRKKFPFKSQFKFVHMRLLESGIAHKFRDDELNRGLTRAMKTDVFNEPVSLEHVAFPLAFYAVSIIFSFLVLAIELVSSLSFKKKKKVSAKHRRILIQEKDSFREMYEGRREFLPPLGTTKIINAD